MLNGYICDLARVGMVAVWEVVVAAFVLMADGVSRYSYV